MKKSRTIAGLSIGLVCAVSGLALPHRVQACAALALEVDPVEVASEEAIIVWDAQTRTQHFIRRATFNTKTSDVGFLVPTPETPQLAEADNNAFSKVEKWMQPQVVDKTDYKYDFTPLMLRLGRVQTVFNTASSELSTSTDSDDINVVSQQQVAGYDATVLEARNTTKLNAWLKSHKYVSSPALMSWIAPYVDKGWKITAFKIARQSAGSFGVTSSAVRMSFHTDRPFFPYREPNQPRSNNSRLLRVALVAPQRMAGDIKGKSWAGQTVWSDNVPTADVADFAKQLGLSSALLDNARLTVLDDHSTVRYAPDDVYFQPDADQSSIVPDPIVMYKTQTILLPADVLLLLSFGAAYALFTLRKRLRTGRPTRGTA